MSLKESIIVVEDDRAIAELLRFNLLNEAEEVHVFRSAEAFKAEAAKRPLGEVMLFILDLMLPGQDGFALCAELRQKHEYRYSRILMLTARNNEGDKVKGLSLGADDYLTKPFGMREFLARVQALKRRYHETRQLLDAEQWPNGAAGRLAAAAARSFEAGSGAVAAAEAAAQILPVQDGTRLEHGPLVLDPVAHRVWLGREEVNLARREYELLLFLLQHPGMAYRREDLLNYVWGYDYLGESRTVDVHVRQLRKKLDRPGEPSLIETVRGHGYRLAAWPSEV